MPDAILKLYRIYYQNNEPLFSEFYSDKIYELQPIDFFGKRLFNGEVYNFIIVLAINEEDALAKAKVTVTV